MAFPGSVSSSAGALPELWLHYSRDSPGIQEKKSDQAKCRSELDQMPCFRSERTAVSGDSAGGYDAVQVLPSTTACNTNLVQLEERAAASA